jgi:uncharacterized protein (UPF0332 family)
MPKTLNNEDRLYLARSYRDKALKTIGDARDLLELKPDLSARMSYEAAYHFTAALFVSEGISMPKTHRGLNSELYRNFVDKGLFPRDIAAYLGQLEKDRSTAQYDPIEKVQAEEAQKDLQKADLFCEAMQKFVEKNLASLEQAGTGPE